MTPLPLTKTQIAELRMEFNPAAEPGSVILNLLDQAEIAVDLADRIADLESQLQAERDRSNGLVDVLEKRIGISFHAADCPYDGNDENQCICGIREARAVLAPKDDPPT